MKNRVLFTLLLSFSFIVANAQIKMHSNGQVSFQSLNQYDGVQIDVVGRTSFEPDISNSSSILTETKAKNKLAKAWSVKYLGLPLEYPYDRFYVTGAGNTYANNYYTIDPGGGGGISKGYYPIENATLLLSNLNGYYYDSHEFEGFEPDFIDNPNIDPQAVAGMMQDLEIDKTLGLNVEDLETVLPEAIRHDPEGMTYINYSAIIPVMVEAIKEQQKEIEVLQEALRALTNDNTLRP